MKTTPHSRSTTWTWGTCQTATTRTPLTRAPWVTGDTPSPLATSSGSLPRSPKAYFKPLWPFRSSPLDSSEVPLARKDNQPRAPNRAEHSRFPILPLLSNKYFGTSYCFGPSITPLLSIEKAIEQSAKTAARSAALRATRRPRISNLLLEGYFYAHYNFFEEISVESPIG